MYRAVVVGRSSSVSCRRPAGVVELPPDIRTNKQKKHQFGKELPNNKLIIANYRIENVRRKNKSKRGGLKLKRQAVFVAFVALLAVLMLVPSVFARTPVKLMYNWYHYDPDDVVWETLIERFNATNEHFVIEPIRGGGDDKLKTMIAGGTAPDVVDFDRYLVVEWAHQGFFQPLDPILKGDIDVERDFLPGPANESIFRGQTYSIPIDTDIRGLLWNRRLLAEAGLDAQSGPTSWPDFNDFIRKATVYDPSGEISQFGFVPWTGNWSNYGWIWHFGGDVFDYETLTPTLDLQGNIDAYEWLREWVQLYGKQQELSDRGYGHWSLNPFFQETQAMMVSHVDPIHHARQAHDIDVGAAALPSVNGVDNGTWSGGFAFVVPTGATNLEGAREVIKFFTSPESLHLWWELRRTIPASYASLSMVDIGAITPEEAALLDLVEKGHWRPPYFGQIIIPRLGEVDNRVLNDLEDPTVALREAQHLASIEYAEVFASQ